MDEPVLQNHITRSATILEITAEIFDEISVAEKKFPGWPVDPLHGIAIVAEECGEVVKAGIDFMWGRGPVDDIELELIQTAAMAIRMIAWLRKEGK